MGDGRPDGLRYTAFLSYSHKDAAAAGRLHRRLETYRMPRRLIGMETARGAVPARLAPIFRDREELPAATDLSETVREALAQSGALIVLCSPAAAGSLWVAEEIETFRTLHPDRPILAAVLDGDPPDCFPAVLRAFGQDGTWHEPLATDLRKHRDGARLGLLKLVAGITGVGLDALVQRDASRRVRRVMVVTGAALVATLIMAALALLALQARREADGQRAEAEGQIEFMLTDLREKLKGVGRLDIMNAVNQRALAYYDRQIARGDLRVDLGMRARVIHAIGEDLLRRGDTRRARSLFSAAHQATSAFLAQSPDDPGRIFAHAQSEYWVGYVDYQNRNLGPARHAWLRYKRLADRLVAIGPADPRWVREAGLAEGNLCTIYMAPPVSAAAALPHCERALELIAQVQQRRASEPALKVDLANRHAWLAMAFIGNRRWDDAEKQRLLHDELVLSLIEADPRNLDYRDIRMSSQYGFGVLLADAGRRREAWPLFVNAARLASDLQARDPVNAVWREWTARIARRMREERINGAQRQSHN